jgi:hypothetical protein
MLHVRDNLALPIAEQDCRVPELHARIDRQRQLIEELAGEGHDITSAQIILDSLFLSLFLLVEDRHRLLDGEPVNSLAPRKPALALPR